MTVSSGPQHGAGHPAVPAAVDDTTTADLTSPRQPAKEEEEEEEEDAAAYESRHVHTVYEAIAPHFSSTRYKPWPLVASFLLSLTPGSVGLDAGCGNGKYIGVNPALYIVASDRSANLVSLARSYQPPHFDAEVSAAAAVSKKKNKKSKGVAATSGPAADAAQTPPLPPRRLRPGLRTTRFW
ncbi:tRNA (uracil-5-)-Methyltransferase TRM9 [Colletotrichum higginsianum]|nr:tRNA (uracil-5-)-Methyltransferase TRM9 [Colletotrichum higginsianum]